MSACDRSEIFPVYKCPLETLYAASALGPKLCFYSLDAKDNGAEIMPRAIPRRPTRLNDTAPADGWDCDLLVPAGERRLREVMHKVKDGRGIFNG